MDTGLAAERGNIKWREKATGWVSAECLGVCEMQHLLNNASCQCAFVCTTVPMCCQHVRLCRLQCMCLVTRAVCSNAHAMCSDCSRHSLTCPSPAQPLPPQVVCDGALVHLAVVHYMSFSMLLTAFKLLHLRIPCLPGCSAACWGTTSSTSLHARQHVTNTTRTASPAHPMPPRL
jgi:hypothetical protein